VLLAEPDELTSIDEEADGLRDADRAKLHAAIGQSLSEIEVGQTLPFAEVISSLRAARAARSIDVIEAAIEEGVDDFECGELEDARAFARRLRRATRVSRRSGSRRRGRCG
jgi:hypothetical protein